MKKKRKYADSLDIIAKSKNVEVVRDGSEAELADVVVCRALTSPLIEPDNLTGVCSKCGDGVQFRPHAPKRPPKICDTCAFPDMQKAMKKDELCVIITPKGLDDVIAHVISDMARKWSN